MMVARRENVFSRNLQEARQLGERRAFMVISVTKTQINCIPLVIQVRVLGSRSFDKLEDPPHFLIALCHKSLETLGVVNKTRFRVLIHEIHDFGKDRVSRRKQFGVVSRAALVPIPEWLPLLSILPRAKNIALGCEDEVWADWKCEISEPGFEKVNGATRVYRQERASLLQFANQFHALRIENWFANARHECAIEIDAQQFDR
jgi:hypothetical protein